MKFFLPLVALWLPFCTGVSLLTDYTIVRPDANEVDAVGVSLLYCHWQGNGFNPCPVGQHSYKGVANFNHTTAKTQGGNELVIKFKQPYLGDPVCFFTQESGPPFLTTVNPEQQGIIIKLFNPDGSNKNWSSYTGWVHMYCIGAMPID
ncbi:uncharacterized protein LOC134183641 [Corticium candelabrum]|uniref:uncharacterized protein LOC134183641 n=1 Tax=Corticium candelabrum TaxID=121492 RepID=UPI002E26BB9C|nr:uncharacterized protein LOC134183641 [Corticium candelabrum]